MRSFFYFIALFTLVVCSIFAVTMLLATSWPGGPFTNIWLINETDYFVWYVITHLYPNFRGGNRGPIDLCTCNYLSMSSIKYRLNWISLANRFAGCVESPDFITNTNPNDHNTKYTGLSC